MDEQVSKAFDFAHDTTKQLTTLSTAVVSLSILFAKDITTNPDSVGLLILGASWVLFLVSIFGGVWTLLALTGSLEPVSNLSDGGDRSISPSIRGSNVIIPSVIQVFAFVFGLLLTVVFGVVSIITVL